MTKDHSIHVAVCALALFLSVATGFAERPQIHCIQGASLVPAPGQLVENGTLILRDGLIEAVGADISAPPDAVVIDGKGLWVYPGLIDPVVDLTPTSGGGDADQHPAANRRESGGHQLPGPVHPLTLVHPESRASDTIRPFAGDLERKAERLRELGFTTVLAVPPSGVFRGSSAAVLLMDDAPVSSIIVKDAVAQHVGFERGRFGDGYPTSLMGTAATIRQVLLDSERYSMWQKRYEERPQGMSRPDHVAAFDALADVVAARQPVVFHTESAAEVMLAYSLADEFNLDAWIVGSGTEWEVVEQIRSGARTVVMPVAFPETPEVGDDDEALEVTVRTMRRYLQAPAAAAQLHEAGVRIALTTHGLKTLSDFKKNLGKMLDQGLTESTALAALTVVPAELLGIDDVAGTLEVGKIANVAVFDGPIFAAESAARHIFVDGIEYRIENKKKPKGGDPDAIVDPRGEWAVIFQMSSGGGERRWLFEGETDALKGTAETRRGIVAFERVELDGNMLTVVLPGREGRGSMELTVVVTGGSFEGTAEFGQRAVRVTGTRTGGPEGGEQ